MKETLLLDEAITVKRLLSRYVADSTAMKDAFDSYMEGQRAAPPGSKKYEDLVAIYREHAGLKGYLQFMGI